MDNNTELFERYQNESNPAEKKRIKEEIFHEYKYLVPYFLQKDFVNTKFSTFEKKDILQAGYEGLLKAIDKYDNTKNASFATYSRYHIFREINRVYYVEDPIVYVPTLAKREVYKYKAEKNSYSKEEKERKEARLKHAINAMKPILYLNGFIRSGDEDIELIEILKDESSENGINEVLNNEILSIIKEEMAQTLTEKENMVVCKLNGIKNDTYNPNGEQYTLDELGKEFSVTRERIRQIYCKAIRKLKIEVAKKDISEDIMEER